MLRHFLKKHEPPLCAAALLLASLCQSQSLLLSMDGKQREEHTHQADDKHGSRLASTTTVPSPSSAQM